MIFDIIKQKRNFPLIFAKTCQKPVCFHKTKNMQKTIIISGFKLIHDAIESQVTDVMADILYL